MTTVIATEIHVPIIKHINCVMCIGMVKFRVVLISENFSTMEKYLRSSAGVYFVKIG